MNCPHICYPWSAYLLLGFRPHAFLDFKPAILLACFLLVLGLCRECGVLRNTMVAYHYTLDTHPGHLGMGKAKACAHLGM